MSEFVLLSQANGVLDIELRRRDKRNALDAAMYHALAVALHGANADNAVRVVVLRGQEDMFCAGNNLAEFLNDDGPGTGPARALLQAVQALDKPLVAAVGGAAIGLGTTLLYHCDVVYATPQARFAMPFVPLGVCPELGATMLGPLYGGYLRAAEAMLFGEPFGVDTACELGLVTRVVEEGQLLAHVAERARKLASLPPNALSVTRKLLRQHGRPASLAAVCVAELDAFDGMLRGREAKAAIGALLSKRAQK